ncbi:MAG TPA: VOC family protein [Acidimicrobiia bacterium]|nr:VOC family protein [Acidimicrobiia bacterium]
MERRKLDQRVSVITLSVSDVDASVDFYRRAFGWEPAFVAEGEVAFYDMGGIVLALWTGLSQELGRAFDPPPGAVTLAYNTRSPEEVDAVFEQAVAAGVTVASSARTQEWGGYSGHIADPNGHLWEIAFNPQWPLDDRGRVRPEW